LPAGTFGDHAQSAFVDPLYSLGLLPLLRALAETTVEWTIHKADAASALQALQRLNYPCRQSRRLLPWRPGRIEDTDGSESAS
jgi:hypothetical protein